MKKINKSVLATAILLISTLFMQGCYKEDISILYSRQHQLEALLEELKGRADNINQQIDVLYSIINNVQNEDFIVDVQDLADGSGYKIVWKKGGEKIIKTKNTGDIPIITVGIEDGVYYWMQQIGDSEPTWILDQNGNKVPAQGPEGKPGQDGQDGQDGKPGEDGKPGQDGQDGKPGEDGKPGQDGQDGKPGEDGKPGQDGQDGLTPVIGIKQDVDGEFYWTVKLGDSPETWVLDNNGGKVKALGKDGQDGRPGQDGSDANCIFKEVDTTQQDYVEFTLADGVTKFRVARYKGLFINFSVDKEGTYTATLTDIEVAGDTVVYFETQNSAITPGINISVIERPDGWKISVENFDPATGKGELHINNDKAIFKNGDIIVHVSSGETSIIAKISVYMLVSYYFDLEDIKNSGGWDKSYVHKVMKDGKQIAEICREHLVQKASISIPAIRYDTGKQPGAIYVYPNRLDFQALVVYQMNESTGKADLSKEGIVAQLLKNENKGYKDLIPFEGEYHGAKISWYSREETNFQAPGQITNPITTSSGAIKDYVAGDTIPISRIYVKSDGTMQIEPTAGAPEKLNIEPYTVKDIDGNEYPIVKIAVTYWMMENLRTTRSRNGNSLTLQNNTAPDYSPDPKYSWYNDGSGFDVSTQPDALKKLYGALYNYPALTGSMNPAKFINNPDPILPSYIDFSGVSDNIAPEGWRIPTSRSNATPGFAIYAFFYDKFKYYLPDMDLIEGYEGFTTGFNAFMMDNMAASIGTRDKQTAQWPYNSKIKPSNITGLSVICAPELDQTEGEIGFDVDQSSTWIVPWWINCLDKDGIIISALAEGIGGDGATPSYFLQIPEVDAYQACYPVRCVRDDY